MSDRADSPRSDLLHLEALPYRVSKGRLLRLLIEDGGVHKERIGRIDLNGSRATVELPAGDAARVARRLDGSRVDNHNIRAWADAPLPDGAHVAHFQRQLRWLALEADAEKEALAQRLALAAADPTVNPFGDGVALERLVIREEDAALGGRLLVTFGRRNAAEPLPWSRLNAGTPVLLSEEGVPDASWHGTVTRLASHTIAVMFDRWPEPSGDRPTFRLDPADDEAARRRQERALRRVLTAGGDRLAQLRAVLLHEDPAVFRPIPTPSFLDPDLNPSQQAAVAFALAADDVAVIHGPPGTGKTTTVVELIRQAVQRGDRVLACAPSNLAVDNLVEPLAAAGVAVVRVGHPARVLPALHATTLDARVADHPHSQTARKLTRDARRLFQQADRFTRARPAPGEKRALRDEAAAMLAEARQLEAAAVDAVLDHATVVCATTTGIDSATFGKRTFDLAVIDEAGQATEANTWIPLTRCRAVVLAGDHCQLPPTVLSQTAAAEGMAVSLLERLVAGNPALARRLTVQYRMHAAIMAFSAEQFYADDLVAHPSVAAHTLADLPGVAATPATTAPLTFIDTAGAGFDEAVEPDGSRWNSGEADVVAGVVGQLLDAGVSAAALAVITPYAAQVRLLRRLLDSAVAVNSVDGFQGQEAEAVVISLVRSNPAGAIGFLADVRRTNVALTRARRRLVIVGDSSTIAAHPFYAALVDACDARGAYRSVWEQFPPA